MTPEERIEERAAILADAAYPEQGWTWDRTSKAVQAVYRRLARLTFRLERSAELRGFTAGMEEVVNRKSGGAVKIEERYAPLIEEEECQEH
jgi:hypothetical protein